MMLTVFLLPDALRELINVLLHSLYFVIAGVEG